MKWKRTKIKTRRDILIRWIWRAHIGDCDNYHHLGCNAV
jgi:hypothetical protein